MVKANSELKKIANEYLILKKGACFSFYLKAITLTSLISYGIMSFFNVNISLNMMLLMLQGLLLSPIILSRYSVNILNKKAKDILNKKISGKVLSEDVFYKNKYIYNFINSLDQSSENIKSFINCNYKKLDEIFKKSNEEDLMYMFESHTFFNKTENMNFSKLDIYISNKGKELSNEHLSNLTFHLLMDFIKKIEEEDFLRNKNKIINMIEKLITKDIKQDKLLKELEYKIKTINKNDRFSHLKGNSSITLKQNSKRSILVKNI
jgi:hypothetical protein